MIPVPFYINQFQLQNFFFFSKVCSSLNLLHHLFHLRYSIKINSSPLLSLFSFLFFQFQNHTLKRFVYIQMLQRKFADQNFQFNNKLQISPLNSGKDLESLQKNRVSAKSMRSYMEPLGQKKINASLEETQQNFLYEQNQRIRKLYQEERNEKSKVCQDRQRVENLMRVAEAEKNNALIQNEKLKNELKNSFNNMRAMQQKINQITQQFYEKKNQNIRLLEENKVLSEKNKIFFSENSNIQQSLWDLQKSTQTISSDNFCLKNDIKNLQLQISDLKGHIKHLERQNENIRGDRRLHKISDQEVHNLQVRLQNYQTAFETKKNEYEGKVAILKEENSLLKENVEKLTLELENKFESNNYQAGQKMNKSMSKIQDQEEVNQQLNQYHIKLAVKQDHIQKLHSHVKMLEQQIKDFKVEKLFLNRERSIQPFSPRKYNDFNQILKSFDGTSAYTSSILRSNPNKTLEVEEKDQEITKLQQHISDLKTKFEQKDIDMKKFESAAKRQSIRLENTMSDLFSQKNKLVRQMEICKNKIQSLQKECAEKDRIILHYVNSTKTK